MVNLDSRDQLDNLEYRAVQAIPDHLEFPEDQDLLEDLAFLALLVLLDLRVLQALQVQRDKMGNPVHQGPLVRLANQV